MSDDAIRIAAIQAAPVYLDPAASTDKACSLIATAGEAGVRLAAFGETWVSGYPAFTVGQQPGTASPKLMARYLASAIEVPGPQTDQLCEAARQSGVDVVIGVSERDPLSGGTVYCTLVFIGSEGRVLGRHRKLKPTFNERMAWGEGDGSSLVAYERDYGRLSGLNCWEHAMMLPGYVLAAQGTQFHIATWPSGGGVLTNSIALASAFATQAACYVISVGGHYPFDDLDDDLRNAVSPVVGSSQVIDPRGVVVASVDEGEGMAVADARLSRVMSAKALCDIGGHYSRPDVFQLRVDRRAARAVSFDEATSPGIDRPSSAPAVTAPSQPGHDGRVPDDPVSQ